MNAKPIAAKILVVDDDPDVRLLVEARLRSNGYTAVAAEDGEACIAACRREKPALLVLDLGLPKIDGFEVCRRVKADPSTRAIPIIVLSAKSQQTDKDLAVAAGADGYMPKPFDAGVLLREIGTLLERKG